MDHSPPAKRQEPSRDNIMNRIYQTIWNANSGAFVVVSEKVKSVGKHTGKRNKRTVIGSVHFVMKSLAAALLFAIGVNAYALPISGVISSGNASIKGNAGNMTITQTSQNATINWQSFNIGPGEAVTFAQPNSSSITLNRVLGSDPSTIFGTLSANGRVFLVNPNGVLFGHSASVNVGGMVASTRNISDSDFAAGNYHFVGSGTRSVVNQGTINANNGAIALLGASVSNQGIIQVNFNTIALAAGNDITLDVAGDGLLNVTVNVGAVNALVQNGGLIQADGGKVLMTAQSAGNLFPASVNNTGVIQAQTLENHQGSIMLMGDMLNGTVNVGGTLDASALYGGNGGTIETSAAHVYIQNSAHISTAALQGQTGSWKIDPQDFTIGNLVTDNISPATLSADLVTNSVTIITTPGSDSTVAGTPPVTTLYTNTTGNGDIDVNGALSWTASSNPTTLTFSAVRDVNINASITATNGNISTCCGRDINVNAAMTTTNGSILLSTGNNINVNAAMTSTDGNISLCAGKNINVAATAAITLTRGTSVPAQSLGLPLGLVINAGFDATGPGAGDGTLTFAPGAPPAAITGPNAPVTIIYNPVAYTSPTNYSTDFTLTNGATLTQKMLVYADGGNKTFTGTTTISLSGLKGSPAGVSLIADPGSTANFDNAAVGSDKVITFSNYSLGGGNAANFALATPCCGNGNQVTTGNILAAPPQPPVPLAILPAAVASVPSEVLSMPGAITPSTSEYTAFAPAPGLELTVFGPGVNVPGPQLTLLIPPEIQPVVVPVVRKPYVAPLPRPIPARN
jgi:filamentous hemagglutinin family protein